MLRSDSPNIIWPSVNVNVSENMNPPPGQASFPSAGPSLRAPLQYQHAAADPGSNEDEDNGLNPQQRKADDLSQPATPHYDQREVPASTFVSVTAVADDPESFHDDAEDPDGEAVTADTPCLRQQTSSQPTLETRRPYQHEPSQCYPSHTFLVPHSSAPVHSAPQEGSFATAAQRHFYRQAVRSADANPCTAYASTPTAASQLKRNLISQTRSCGSHGGAGTTTTTTTTTQWRRNNPYLSQVTSSGSLTAGASNSITAHGRTDSGLNVDGTDSAGSPQTTATALQNTGSGMVTVNAIVTHSSRRRAYYPSPSLPLQPATAGAGAGGAGGAPQAVSNGGSTNSNSNPSPTSGTALTYHHHSTPSGVSNSHTTRSTDGLLFHSASPQSSTDELVSGALPSPHRPAVALSKPAPQAARELSGGGASDAYRPHTPSGAANPASLSQVNSGVSGPGLVQMSSATDNARLVFDPQQGIMHTMSSVSSLTPRATPTQMYIAASQTSSAANNAPLGGQGSSFAFPSNYGGSPYAAETGSRGPPRNSYPPHFRSNSENYAAPVGFGGGGAMYGSGGNDGAEHPFDLSPTVHFHRVGAQTSSPHVDCTAAGTPLDDIPRSYSDGVDSSAPTPADRPAAAEVADVAASGTAQRLHEASGIAGSAALLPGSFNAPRPFRSDGGPPEACEGVGATVPADAEGERQHPPPPEPEDSPQPLPSASDSSMPSPTASGAAESAEPSASAGAHKDQRRQSTQGSSTDQAPLPSTGPSANLVPTVRAAELSAMLAQWLDAHPDERRTAKRRDRSGNAETTMATTTTTTTNANADVTPGVKTVSSTPTNADRGSGEGGSASPPPSSEGCTGKGHARGPDAAADEADDDVDIHNQEQEHQYDDDDDSNDDTVDDNSDDAEGEEETAHGKRTKRSGRRVLPPSDELMCPGGFSLSVYDADISQHYTIPSEDVAVTRGALKYLTLYERYGMQTRFRFQLCRRYLRQRCANGCDCRYIHSKTVPTATWVHLNENCVTSISIGKMSAEDLAGGKNSMNYETMPRGVLFRVYSPNQSQSTPQAVPSHLILRTIGAENVYRVLKAASLSRGHTTQQRGGFAAASSADAESDAAADAPVNMKPRHCAHFQFKRMCNLGTSCNFIHSLVPFIQGLQRRQAHHRGGHQPQSTPGGGNWRGHRPSNEEGAAKPQQQQQQPPYYQTTGRPAEALQLSAVDGGAPAFPSVRSDYTPANGYGGGGGGYPQTLPPMSFTRLADPLQGGAQGPQGPFGSQPQGSYPPAAWHRGHERGAPRSYPQPPPPQHPPAFYTIPSQDGTYAPSAAQGAVTAPLYPPPPPSMPPGPQNLYDAPLPRRR